MIDTVSTQIDYDETFIFAPSFLLAEKIEAEGGVFEGKAIGTADQADLILAQDQFKAKDADPESYTKARKVGTDVGRKKLKETQSRVRTKLLKYIRQFQEADIDEREFRKRSTAAMKTAWKDVFLAGIRAGGTPGTGAGKGKTLVALAAGDDKWLKSAMQHEMRFLNGFIRAILENDYKMPLPRRVGMYVESLRSFYDSARVIAMPANVVIHWKGPNDKLTCSSCAYLFSHTPFTKATLPTTPRAGMTLCLCLTDCDVDILTSRGTIPWREVRVGDAVFTHRRRWRKVLRKTVNRVQSGHGFAVIVGENGRLFGVTDDHCVWTEYGWIEARQAAECGIPVLSLREPDHQEKSERALSIMRDAQAMGRSEGSRTKTNFEDRARFASDAVRRPDLRLVQHDQGGRSEVWPVLGRRYDPIRLSLPLAVAAGKWADPGRIRIASQERGLYGRPLGEPATYRAPQARASARQTSAGQSDACFLPTLRTCGTDESIETPKWARELLFARLCIRSEVRSSRVGMLSVPDNISQEAVGGRQTSGRQRFLLAGLLRDLPEVALRDPCVRLLRQEFQASPERRQTVEVGQVLLLSSVLPQGSPLYDLTVADDNSFVAAGMIVHNTNCRDRLLIRRVTADVAEATTEASVYTRGGHVKNLRTIKRQGFI